MKMMSLFEITKKHLTRTLEFERIFQSRSERLQHEILCSRYGAQMMDMLIWPIVQLDMSRCCNARDRLNALIEWESEVVGYLWTAHYSQLLHLLKVPDRRINCFNTKKNPLDQLNDYIEAMNDDTKPRRRIFQRENTSSVISRETFIQQCPGGLDPKTWIEIGLSTGRIYLLPQNKTSSQKNTTLPAHMTINMSRSQGDKTKDADGLIVHPFSGFHLTQDDVERLENLFIEKVSYFSIELYNNTLQRLEENRIKYLCQQFTSPSFWQLHDSKTSIFSNLDKAWKICWFELEDKGWTDKHVYDEIERQKQFKQLQIAERSIRLVESISSVSSEEEIEKKRQQELEKQKAAKRAREDAIKKMALEKAREDTKRKEIEKKLLGKNKGKK